MAELAKRTIKDRIAVGDDIFTVTDLGGGKIKLTPAPQEVAEAGTDVNAALLQPLEDARVEHAAAIAALQKLSPPAFYVTVTESLGNGALTPNKSMDDIQAALVAERSVFCIFISPWFGNIPAYLPLLGRADGQMYIFGGIAKYNGNMINITTSVTDGGWSRTIDAVVTSVNGSDGSNVVLAPLTFTGAVTGTYNGLEALTVDIPSQDELIFSTVTTEAVQTFTTTTDNSGQAFNLKKWVLEIYCPFANPGNYWSYIDVTVPGGSPNSTTHDLARFEPVTGGDDFKYGAFRYEGSADSGVGRWIGTGTDRGGVAPVLNNLTSITMRATGATVDALPIGTKITLKGVRA